MNVYDFDKTIYKKDCSVEFYKYVVKKKPLIFFRCISRQALAAVQYKIKRITKEQFKEEFFCFLEYIDADYFLNEFIQCEINNMADWYLQIKKADDVVISASPKFIVDVFAEKVGIKYVIATNMNKKTGKITGKNCHGQEKVRRFDKCFEEQVDNFYSDSLSDTPMAQKAKNAYLVKKGKKQKWEFGENYQQS